jgi:hypothetical protein
VPLAQTLFFQALLPTAVVEVLVVAVEALELQKTVVLVVVVRTFRPLVELGFLVRALGAEITTQVARERLVVEQQDKDRTLPLLPTTD